MGGFRFNLNVRQNFPFSNAFKFFKDISKIESENQSRRFVISLPRLIWCEPVGQEWGNPWEFGAFRYSTESQRYLPLTRRILSKVLQAVAIEDAERKIGSKESQQMDRCHINVHINVSITFCSKFEHLSITLWVSGAELTCTQYWRMPKSPELFSDIKIPELSSWSNCLFQVPNSTSNWQDGCQPLVKNSETA